MTESAAPRLEATWDYSAMPRRVFTWYVEHDPQLRCPCEKDASVTPNGIGYSGDARNPNWGGGYTIGFQTFEAFLEHGPPDEQMPESVASEIRAHIETHRRPGVAGEVELIALVDIPGVSLRRVDWTLDGVPGQSHHASEVAAEHVFFRGPLPLGTHRLSAAFVLDAAPGLAYLNDFDFEAPAGTLRLRCRARARHDVVVEPA